jgi:hypothetical protein
VATFREETTQGINCGRGAYSSVTRPPPSQIVAGKNEQGMPPAHTVALAKVSYHGIATKASPAGRQGVIIKLESSQLSGGIQQASRESHTPPRAAVRLLMVVLLSSCVK